MDLIPHWAIGVSVMIFAGAFAQILVVKMRASVRVPPQDKRVDELREAYHTLQDRVGELEERLDFTERVLAQQREAKRLEPPQQ